MKIKSLHTSVFCFFIPMLFFGQVNVSEILQPSKIVKQDNNALYFIDFWATWCGPCIHVKKYLTTLQEQHSENFYVISISQENPDKVKHFLERKPTALAVAIDYNGDAFKKYNVKSLPYGVLLNAEGDIIWEGHPANFKSNHINRFLKQNRKKTSFNQIFSVKSSKVLNESISNVYEPKLDFEFFEIERESNSTLQILNYSEYLEVKGSLQDILSYFFKVYRGQIHIDVKENLTYKMYFKHNTNSDPVKAIFNALDIDYSKSFKNGEVLMFNVENSKFWDTNQINWGSDNRNYLINDVSIQADNVSFKSIQYKIASLLEKPIIVKGNYDESSLHDWQIHYKYFDLMKNDLLDSYGVTVNKQVSNYLFYIITKKAP